MTTGETPSVRDNVHQLPTLELATVTGWPKNWGWHVAACRDERGLVGAPRAEIAPRAAATPTADLIATMIVDLNRWSGYKRDPGSSNASYRGCLLARAMKPTGDREGRGLRSERWAVQVGMAVLWFWSLVMTSSTCNAPETTRIVVLAAKDGLARILATWASTPLNAHDRHVH